MTLTLPPRPYETHALRPRTGTSTVELHAHEHQRRDRDRLRESVGDSHRSRYSLEEIRADSTGAVLDHASPLWNHAFDGSGRAASQGG
jgi:hypothetical protein